VSQRHSVGAVCGMDRSCRAHWSLRPTGKLLFFVHGFGGEATSTWRSFPQLLLEDSRWAGWDLFFYGYDSRRIRAGISAQLLERQARNVIEQPHYANAWLLENRPPGFSYNEVWFVTHSLGAVVVRQMLTEAERHGANWIRASHLVCFAPASVVTLTLVSRGRPFRGFGPQTWSR
jgi:pimeloyl-ACP methyl ester carboxylesterase